SDLDAIVRDANRSARFADTVSRADDKGRFVPTDPLERDRPIRQQHSAAEPFAGFAWRARAVTVVVPAAAGEGDHVRRRAGAAVEDRHLALHVAMRVHDYPPVQSATGRVVQRDLAIHAEDRAETELRRDRAPAIRGAA